MSHTRRRVNQAVGFSVVVMATAMAWTVRTAPVHAQGQTIRCATGFGAVVEPVGAPAFVPMTSLRLVPNPVLPLDPATGKVTLRNDLTEYVANIQAAVRLGKALFWDMQAGSDNKTACASCHFHAGADSRTKNQLNPAMDGSWNGYAPNQAFDSYGRDFPLPLEIDNAAGSQGVRRLKFGGIGRGGVELTSAVADPVFNVGGVNVRQTTGRNTPTTINAVFNHRGFFDGRAQPEFNGISAFGARDATTRVYSLDVKGTPVPVDVHILEGSLASQGVGPLLNGVEMSAIGRTFPDVAKKLLALKPLGLQKVSPTDSILGPVADTTKGLKVTYTALVQQAFQPKWWNSKKTVVVNGRTLPMIEANFSLFWGLSLMLYQATLVSDDTPMDRYLATRVFDASGTLVSHNPALLDEVVQQLQADLPGITRDRLLNGLALFERPVAPAVNGQFPMPPPAGTGVGCSLCHLGAETTSASIRNLAGAGLEQGHTAMRAAGFDIRVERMFMDVPPVPAGSTSLFFDAASYTVIPESGIPARVSVYDVGWYNIGVRPTAEDEGIGGQDPFGNALSWTRLFQSLPQPGQVKVPGGGLGCATTPPAAPASSPFAGEVLNPLTNLPLLAGPLLGGESTDVAGGFKTSSLRNVELTAPYFHNGGKATLLQAMALYNQGGDFRNETLSPLIRPLGMTREQMEDLVAFLVALTDERVRWERAPFDHPQLLIPEGDNPVGVDVMRDIPAVGATGAPTPLRRFLGLNPFR